MQVEGEKVNKRLAEVLGYFAVTASAIKANTASLSVQLRAGSTVHLNETQDGWMAAMPLASPDAAAHLASLRSPLRSAKRNS